MKAMSLKEGTLAIREVARPAPGSGQILVRTLACAICASDITTWTTPEVVRSRMQIHAPHDDVVDGPRILRGDSRIPDTARAWPVGTSITATPVPVHPRRSADHRHGTYFPAASASTSSCPRVSPARCRNPFRPENLAHRRDAGRRLVLHADRGSPTRTAVPLVIGLGAIGLYRWSSLSNSAACAARGGRGLQRRQTCAGAASGCRRCGDPAVEQP